MTTTELKRYENGATLQMPQKDTTLNKYLLELGEEGTNPADLADVAERILTDRHQRGHYSPNAFQVTSMRESRDRPLFSVFVSGEVSRDRPFKIGLITNVLQETIKDNRTRTSY